MTWVLKKRWALHSLLMLRCYQSCIVLMSGLGVKSFLQTFLKFYLSWPLGRFVSGLSCSWSLVSPVKSLVWVQLAFFFVTLSKPQWRLQLWSNNLMHELLYLQGHTLLIALSKTNQGGMDAFQWKCILCVDISLKVPHCIAAHVYCKWWATFLI